MTFDKTNLKIYYRNNRIYIFSVSNNLFFMAHPGDQSSQIK